MVNDWGHSRESIDRDLRVWLLRENEMPISEFVQSFNNDITNSVDQSFNFPGKSLEQRRHTTRTSQDFVQMDEIAALLSSEGPPGAIFIEVKRGERPWLFSLDEFDDPKFYKSVLQSTSSHTS